MGRRGLVPDLTRRLEFEKTLLPDRAAEQLIADQERWRSFCAWCARRYSPVAFSDELNLTIGSAIGRAISGLGERPEVDAIHSWRVLIDEEDGVVNVALLCAMTTRKRQLLMACPPTSTRWSRGPRATFRTSTPGPRSVPGGSISEHRLVGHLAAPSDRVTMRDLREALPMSFEHSSLYVVQSGTKPHVVCGLFLIEPELAADTSNSGSQGCASRASTSALGRSSQRSVHWRIPWRAAGRKGTSPCKWRFPTLVPKPRAHVRFMPGASILARPRPAVGGTSVTSAKGRARKEEHRLAFEL